jgi:hypothetical protein
LFFCSMISLDCPLIIILANSNRKKLTQASTTM